MANPAIVVDFIANTRDLQKGMSQATGASKGFGDKLKTLGKVAGAAALGGLVATLKIGIDEFAEASKVAAQTNSVLKSTGGVANVTAGQVNNLAGALMKKTGIDDEAIQSGENLLLTFTDIRNEAGKGNDVFTQATKTMTDMSVALGQDMKTSAIQLGKALNNPIKGMTALQRVGVSFTDAQKDQVAAMVKSGDTMGAQKLILKELNKEFGGSAEAAGKTLPGQLNILKQEFSNFAGTLIGTVVPPLTAILKLLMDHKPVVIALAAVFGTLAAVLIAISLATKAWAAIQLVAKAATVAWTAVQWLLNAALDANPIGLVVIAVAALVAAFVLAYKYSDTFRKAVQDAFDAILDAAKAVFSWLKSNWPLLLAIISGPIGLATLAVVKNWDTIKSTVTGAVTAVKNAVTAAWDAVKNTTSSVWGAVAGFVSDAVSSIKSLLGGLASWVAGFATGAWSTAINGVRVVFDRISDAVHDAVQAVKDAFNGLVGFIGSIVGRVGKAASDVADAIKAPINSVIKAWNGLGFHVPKISLPSVKVLGHKIGGGSFGGWDVNFPDLPLLAKGGVIASPTLAMVGEGRGREIVTPENLLRQIVGEQSVNVRVFIGETELTGIVDARIDQSNTGLARGLLAGGGGLMALTATAEPQVRSVRLDHVITSTGVAVTFSRTGPSRTPAVVRGWDHAEVVPGPVVARDFEAPIGVPLTYTALIYSAAGAVISTQTVDITLDSQGCDDTWITDLARVANTMQVALESLPELDFPVPVSVHEIITRRDPIVTSDIAHTPSFELSFLTDTLDERDRAKALLGNGVPVLLRTPPEDGIGNLYFSVLGYREQRIVQQGTQPARRFVAQGRQVVRPDPGLYVPLGVATYQEVDDQFATYAALKAGHADYDAVLYSWAGSTASDIVPWPPDDV